MPFGPLFSGPARDSYATVSVWDSDADIRRFTQSSVLRPVVARLKPLKEAEGVRLGFLHYHK